jgi:septum formation protein
MNNLSSHIKLVLGSGSPRRKELLSQLGYSFEVRKGDADEIAPSHLNGNETAVFLALQKAEGLKPTLAPDELLITSDTEVWKGDRRFGKPANLEEAKAMLRELSGDVHQVISSVCICDLERTESTSVTTNVFFKDLSEVEINYYVTNYKPLDKAGAYGIQEWIGLVGIEKIEGSYFNVVGLPVFELAELLNSWEK